MTDIRIPASIDQRAAEHLEEGTLIDFVLESIRGYGLRAEIRDVDAKTFVVPITDILVSSQPSQYWHWKVAVDTVTPSYTIYVQLFGGDSLTYIGKVNSLGALLAILLSGVDFDPPSDVVRYPIPKGEGTNVPITKLQREVGEAHNALDLKGVSMYLVRALSNVGIGTNLEGDCVRVLRYNRDYYANNSVIYKITPRMENSEISFIISKPCYDQPPWDLTVGKVTGITAVVALASSGAQFYGDLGPSFTDKGDTLYMDSVEDKSTEAYDEAKYQGNCLPICTRIANVLRDMGYSAVVKQYYQDVLLPEGGTVTTYTNTYQVLIREGGTATTIYTITALLKGYEELGFDIHYHPVGGGAVISLGEVSTVALVVAVVCTGIDFKEQAA